MVMSVSKLELSKLWMSSACDALCLNSARSRVADHDAMPLLLQHVARCCLMGWPSSRERRSGVAAADIVIAFLASNAMEWRCASVMRGTGGNGDASSNVGLCTEPCRSGMRCVMVFVTNTRSWQAGSCSLFHAHLALLICSISRRPTKVRTSHLVLLHRCFCCCCVGCGVSSCAAGGAAVSGAASGCARLVLPWWMLRCTVFLLGKLRAGIHCRVVAP